MGFINVTNDTYFQNSLKKLDGKSHWNNLMKSKYDRKEVIKYVYYGRNNPIGSVGPGARLGLRYGDYKLLWIGEDFHANGSVWGEPCNHMKPCQPGIAIIRTTAHV